MVCFPSAKKEGMLRTFADGAQKMKVRLALGVQGILCVGWMVMTGGWSAVIVALAAFAVFGGYYWKCRKELGGITGDTAGWFVVVCEVSIAVVGAVVNGPLDL